MVGMLELLGLREILEQEITTIKHEGEDCAIAVEKNFQGVPFFFTI